LIVYLEAIELLSDKKRSVEQYTSVGGTAPEATRRDIANIRQLIDCHFKAE
jgi:argininosuccinate lyase